MPVRTTEESSKSRSEAKTRSDPAGRGFHVVERRIARERLTEFFAAYFGCTLGGPWESRFSLTAAGRPFHLANYIKHQKSPPAEHTSAQDFLQARSAKQVAGRRSQ